MKISVVSLALICVLMFFASVTYFVKNHHDKKIQERESLTARVRFFEKRSIILDKIYILDKQTSEFEDQIGSIRQLKILSGNSIPEVLFMRLNENPESLNEAVDEALDTILAFQQFLQDKKDLTPARVNQIKSSPPPAFAAAQENASNKRRELFKKLDEKWNVAANITWDTMSKESLAFVRTIQPVKYN